MAFLNYYQYFKDLLLLYYLIFKVVLCKQLFGQQVVKTGTMTLLHAQWHTWLEVFVTGDKELAPGNLNPLPVEVEQLTCTASGEVGLTLALSGSCWRKDTKVGWQNSSASGGTLLSHVFVWVQSLTHCTLQQEAVSQQSYPKKPIGLINIDAVSASLGISSACRVLLPGRKCRP